MLPYLKLAIFLLGLDQTLKAFSANKLLFKNILFSVIRKIDNNILFKNRFYFAFKLKKTETDALKLLFTKFFYLKLRTS